MFQSDVEPVAVVLSHLTQASGQLVRGEGLTGMRCLDVIPIPGKALFLKPIHAFNYLCKCISATTVFYFEVRLKSILPSKYLFLGLGVV